MRPIEQVWVSYTAGVPLILNVGDPIDILRKLAVLRPGTLIILLSRIQIMNKSTIHTRDHSVESELEQITNFILIF